MRPYSRRLYAFAANGEKSLLWDGRAVGCAKGLEAGLTLGVKLSGAKAHSHGLSEYRGGLAMVFSAWAAAQRYFHKPPVAWYCLKPRCWRRYCQIRYAIRRDAPSGYARSRQAWIMRRIEQLGGESFMTAASSGTHWRRERYPACDLCRPRA